MQKDAVFPILRSLCAIALPISAGRLFHILGNFIAMMMVAQFGNVELAAGALAIPSTITIITLTSTIFYAIGIRIRYVQGQNNPALAIGKLVKNGFLLAMIIAIPAAYLISSLDKMLLAIGQDPQLVALTKTYFFYAGLGMIPLLGITVISQFYLGIGKPYFALLIECISLPLTVLVSYAVILGHFGFSASGLTGVSLANLLTQSVLLVFSLIAIYLSKYAKMYQLFKNPFGLDWSICHAIFTLGLPIGFQFGGELAAMAAASYLMGYYGVNTLAALQITSQYSIVIIMLTFGLSQALSLKISELHGKNAYPLLTKYLRTATALLLFYLIPVAVLFCSASRPLAEFYMGTPSLQPDFNYLLNAFFILSAFFLLCDGLRNLLSSTLRGLHDSQTASRINLLALWFISLPLSGLSVFVFHGGPIALRFAFLSGFLVAVIMLARHLHTKMGLISMHAMDGSIALENA